VALPSQRSGALSIVNGFDLNSRCASKAVLIWFSGAAAGSAVFVPSIVGRAAWLAVLCCWPLPLGAVFALTCCAAPTCLTTPPPGHTELLAGVDPQQGGQAASGTAPGTSPSSTSPGGLPDRQRGAAAAAGWSGSGGSTAHSGNLHRYEAARQLEGTKAACQSSLLTQQQAAHNLLCSAPVQLLKLYCLNSLAFTM